MNESKIRKGFELISKQWKPNDIVERLDLNYSQIHALVYAKQRGAYPHQLTEVMDLIGATMRFVEVDELVDEYLSNTSKYYKP